MTRPAYVFDIDRIRFEPTRSDDDRKFEVLGTNIAQNNGLLYPLIVRQVGDSFVVVEGERRLKALRWLHESRVPCRIVAGQSPQAALLSMVEARDQLQLDPFTVAEALERAFYVYRITLEDVTNWADTTRHELLRTYTLLMRASPALRKAIHDGWVTPGQAEQLALYPVQRQHQFLKTIYTGTREVSDGGKRGGGLFRRSAEGHRGAAPQESTRARAIQEDRRTRL